MEYASNGKGNLGVTLGAIGTGLSALNGGLGNILGGRGNCESDHVVSRYEAEQSARIAELETEEGKSSVSELQKLEAVVDSGLSQTAQEAALSVLMSEDSYAKYETVREYGVTPEYYVTFKQAMPEYDEDGNGKYTQKEVTSAIVSMFPMFPTQEQKRIQAALWQMANKQWKSKNNPFSTSVGEEVYQKMNG